MKNLFIIISFICATAFSADKIIHSSDAENVAPIKEYPEKTKMWVKCKGNAPRGWGAYLGGGKGEWGATDKEAHSGKYSAFLTFRDWYFDKKSKRKKASMALLIGEGNGYTCDYAIPVKPEKNYEFSFWLKGNISFINIAVQGWDKNGKRISVIPRRIKRNGLSVRARSRGTVINPNPNKWEKYTGEFTTPENVVKVVIMISINNPILLSPGQTIYADDAQVTEKK